MILVCWNGRLGNQLFEYAIGRILAEELGYELRSGTLNGFPATGDRVSGTALMNLIDLPGQFLNRAMIDQNRDKAGFIINGWFQRYEYYQPHKEKIRAWFNRDMKKGSVVPTENDLVIHIRRTQQTMADTKTVYTAVSRTELKVDNDFVRGFGDYQPGQIVYANGDLLPWEYYKKAIDENVYERLIILTDCPNDPFLGYFQGYHPLIISGDLMDDFNILRSAQRIVMSISTFSWWGAFLSEAEEIYMPIPDHGMWHIGSDVDLRVFDEPRFKQVPVVRNGKLYF